MPDDNRTQGLSNDAPRDPLDDLIYPILNRDAPVAPPRATARPAASFNGRSDPLDDLVTDRELLANSRKAPMTSPCRPKWHILRTSPIRVLFLVAFFLVLIGVFGGTHFANRREQTAPQVSDNLRPQERPTTFESSAHDGSDQENEVGRQYGLRRISDLPEYSWDVADAPVIELPNAKADNRRQAEPSPAKEISTPIIEQVERSVVLIRTQKGQPIGSGFIFDSDKGIVVTNWHVVEGAHDLVVEFFDGQSENVLGFLGVSQDNDLATLKVGGLVKRYPQLEVADRLPKKRDYVLAVGSPWGLKGTETDGIVSSTRKASEIPHAGIGQWIQHSAPISPGNSGGPLVDADGKVIGVNTLGFKAEFGQNINFAISALHIREVVRDGFNEPRRLADLPVREKPKPPAINPAKPQDDEGSLKEAQKHIAAGVSRRAMQVLDDIPEDRRGPNYWRVRASALFAVANYQDSAKCYSESLQLDNTHSDTWIRYATALRLHWVINKDAILTACRAALSIDANDARAYYLMGVTLPSREERIDALKTALSLDENDAGTHYQLGCEFAERQKSDARKHFKRALDLVVKDHASYQAIKPLDRDPSARGMTLEQIFRKYGRLDEFTQQNSLETFFRLNLAAACAGEECISICRDVLKSEPQNKLATHMIEKAMVDLGRVRRNDVLLVTTPEFSGEVGLSSGTTGILVFRK